MEDKMEKVDKPRITKAESWKEFNATRKNISIQPVKRRTGSADYDRGRAETGEDRRMPGEALHRRV